MNAGAVNQAHKMSLSVQYASQAKNLPTRQQFRRWIKVALEREVRMVLRIVGEAEGRALNRDYRGKDYATNVLTFVYDDTTPLAGDLVICAPVVAREAKEQGKDLLAHYAHLTLHAALHLQGYDHQKQREAERMEARETALMKKLRYPAPYLVS
ncbi:MAG: rRNA maturation RNase YbeY [Gallionella sp.]|nr:rRNA maturation RNase YbeY [Gallionella sp.]PIR09554.1 MAG: rRNA maturation RNase YbeY [Gallionellaceae bacterium CG11_big_fil_rev_8_21_14_0_20_60_62]PIV47699.1 MAG: rRNA maturation RNase YbeY [Gallionellaceae bacterium CG02_land_8_20_14_3_00_60_115]PIY06126.1 MAG: rRNA maturation RNase YbeY [Gallionellaceae bacterium CG_4_10_14_3_um_filter_60_1069]PJC04195.1 MAG: rRNA maturation RNase YbeY [Gallionellaceae bacterium CG_4_9_14_0_8_um_filter_60_335]